MPRQILQLKQSQQLTLTPQLQQAITLLNMNQLDLALEVRQMLSQNFMLSSESEFDSETTTEHNDSEEYELDYDDSELWADCNHDWPTSSNNNSEYTAPETYTANSVELHTFIAEQILLMPLDETTMSAALALAYLLDERGYLTLDEASAKSDYNIDKNTYQAAVTALQQCQPSGIGARDLEEALNLQIAALPADTNYLSTLKRIMRRHFAFLSKDSERVQKQLDLCDEEFQGALALLRSLHPYPADNYEAPIREYIEPEVIVHERGGISYIARFDTHLPALSINSAYAAVQPNNEQEKTLLRAQLSEAKWFIGALEKREDTIRRVASIIVATQQDFFQQGDIAMRPLTRAQVAEMLDVHESTVARAVNGKYLQCKRGVYELREFFSHAVSSSEDGEEASVKAIKAIISGLIESENKKKPLSDQKICDMLAEEGHQLARRTVAKYRESLGIPAAPGRRER
ncbi:RNA polymerase factor sigma-54 [Cardiobacteriaceae bacterium TAE3-ERU3]|nr:RNA polymerase factor sigma-54 [Cardiobacteriaceae bacterium TAE3-ERU3]